MSRIPRVLIVDDEEIIRDMLEIELEDHYEVVTAENGEQAFTILNEKSVDLVISDINMPGIKGYELLRLIKDKYPATKTALITAYNTDDYIRMAKESDISNIIPKSIPFNFDEFNTIVDSLVTEKIFGLERYMQEDFELLEEYDITSSRQIVEVEDQILSSITRFHKPQPFVQILLEELITNAVYHAPVDESGAEKYQKHSDVTLQESEKVKIKLGKDSEKYGVSVTDTSGKLTKQQVLYRIDRHIHGEGVLDEHGRGLHMSRLYSDRLIINIKRDVITEAIFINYLNDKYKGFKPLYINEI
ncbi:MAG: response regulator [Chitinivibrionales bacterium]